ncbi:hypothetical protein IT407_00685 [Candidatus Uhrbacteria bacterium]|nr:hypothetical protein [Candidatus Uhrbacteria bacterium]
MGSYALAKTSYLAKAVQSPKPVDVPDTSRITVHAAVSRFAVLYERIRNAVDYQDDHLLRKAAIYRILKRHLSLESQPEEIATQLLRELVAARYFPNGFLPDTKIQEAAKVIHKYLAVKRVHVGNERYDSWLLGIISAEMEEVLDDHSQPKAFVNFLFEQLCERITIKDGELDETERRLQVYVACHRMLIKADADMIGFKLLRAYEPAWMRPEEWVESPTDMAVAMAGLEPRVYAALRHPLAPKFQAAIKPWSISLNILRTALLEDPSKAEALMNDPAKLHAAVERIAERRILESKAKLRRGTVRAMIYLFVTKMLVAILMEVPSELAVYREIHRIPLAVNVIFPPILMLLVGILIRPPSKDNVKRIKQGVDELLSPEGPKGREVRLPKKNGFWGWLFLTSAYLFAFVVTFGLVFFLLDQVHFTWISSLIFVFFLCVVSFFAFRLRSVTREFVAVERPESLVGIFMDFFSIPILRAGRYLSETISQFNVFVFFFDFIFEAPFKIFLNLLEEWSAFMKEKKEQLQ